MPKSKTRKNHHDYRPPGSTIKSAKNRSAVTIGIIFFALIGIGIAYFASSSSSLWPLWLLAGAVIGAIAGYFFGHQIDKTIAKK